MPSPASGCGDPACTRCTQSLSETTCCQSKHSHVSESGSYMTWGSTFPCDWQCIPCEYIRELESTASSAAKAIAQSAASSAKANAAASDNAAKISASGGVARIIDALIRHKESAAVVAQACGAIKNLSTSRPDNQKIIVDSGGIERVLVVLGLHKNVAEVQEQAIGALLAISRNRPEYLARMRKLSALELVEAANNHKDATEKTKIYADKLSRDLIDGMEPICVD
mmetsp:Transcript_16633/g.24444  ORF Transcript_16633/g.24444 Transcript_16633/m.24444 type:complete len:225 (-) Transcript_16633:85-759(-)